MALSNYAIPRTEINVKGGDPISVRGLSLEDISFLVSVHKDDMNDVVEMFKTQALADKVVKAGSDLDPSVIEAAVRNSGDKLLSSFLQSFPLLAANLIAVACDEPDAWQNARMLPVPVQVELILAIARLTFEDVDGFKKFVGNVVAAMQSVSAQASQLASSTSKRKPKKSTGSTD